MHPFFSIIVPCCEVEPYVRECLDSVLSQPFQNWECLIGVEASKDRTEEIVREYAAKDSRFKMFTGPRSGSCSASRNKGIDMATGDYVIFLDGDDWIAEDSLQALHDKITARPGADIYPCAMQIHDETIPSAKTVLRHDNFSNVSAEMNGIDATLFHHGMLGMTPNVMLQLNIYRREFLCSNHLKCIYGLRAQDMEFTPRATYLAKRVIPLHDSFYNYRIRTTSIQRTKKQYSFYEHYATIIRSLLSFYKDVSKTDGFDKRVANEWAHSWIARIDFEWFFPKHVKEIPRQRRLETLQLVFSNGFEAFDDLLRYASPWTKLKGLLIRAFVKHPALRKLTELFFLVHLSLRNLRHPQINSSYIL
ncbi:MAG: glycosyltransferase [Victivallales bacterium]|nr:glycosyltransferase [Victivallales bacterium]